ncbi:MAG TPA: DUF4157 domain-containing protein [Kofleriaceae bacterium]
MSDQDQTEPTADQLTDELARKYDPERMLRMVSRRAGKGERLDHSIREKYEKRFGVDLGHVRIYTGEFAEEFNRQRGAYAVTIGSTGMILMGGSPEKSMGSASGQALLAHELTHVAQAQQGLHRKATFSGGMPFAEEHESEAEAVEHSVEQSGGSHDSTHAAAQEAAAQAASKEAMARAIEQIKQRVQEMAAEAARNQILRYGIHRRA